MYRRRRERRQPAAVRSRILVPFPGSSLKILVVIANYGTGNDRYLAQLLAEYRAMPYDLRIIVTSNLEKDLGDDVEVKTGLPSSDPWSLPFAHQRIFAENADLFDLYIYSEDDILLTAKNVDAFLRATTVLPDNKIAGFLRTEIGPDGERYFPDVHSSFHWDPGSVTQTEGLRHAAFSCDHSGCYAVTRQQLRTMLSSRRFPAQPRSSINGMAETAATDCYTRCGLTRVICYSELESFLVPHLSNKYLGTAFDCAEREFAIQITALDEILLGRRSTRELLNTETSLPLLRWSKDYYEPPRTQLLELIDPSCRTVLSVGCGWGKLEGECLALGLKVTAIPLDSVIAKCAEARKVKTLTPSLDLALAELEISALTASSFLICCIWSVVHRHGFLRSRKNLDPPGR